MHVVLHGVVLRSVPRLMMLGGGGEGLLMRHACTADEGCASSVAGVCVGLCCR